MKERMKGMKVMIGISGGLTAFAFKEHFLKTLPTGRNDSSFCVDFKQEEYHFVS